MDIQVQQKTKNSRISRILSEVDDYQTASQSKRNKWVECYKHYMSHLDSSKNPFLSNMFIPKSHEAVELLAAFLAGSNQTIDAEPEGYKDTNKAIVIQRWLDFGWRKIIRARDKIITWIKQALVFSNGIMQLWWDEDKNFPDMDVANISDMYFDFYTANIQESYSVIRRFVKNIEDIKLDDSFNRWRKEVICVNENLEDEETTQFNAYDGGQKKNPSTQETQKVEYYERYCKDEDRIEVIAPTRDGYKVLRKLNFKDAGFTYRDGTKFYPFVKVRVKKSPLSNRAYDIGALEPTIKLQKAYNDMCNELFDNVSLINNKMWVRRSGSGIKPTHLVRRPGGVIVAKDINKDIKELETTDIKQSGLEMLKLLDDEFQQASMVVNILKAVPGADTATEASLGQQNVMTLLDMVDENIKDSMSEIGQMLVEMLLSHSLGKQTIKIFDNEKLYGFLEFDVKEVDGKYDIRISADREAPGGKVVRRKQMLDLLAILSKDQILQQQYPGLRMKIIKRWLRDGGESDVDYFFEEENQNEMGGNPESIINLLPKGIGSVKVPSRNEGLTENNIVKSANTSGTQAEEVKI